MSATNTPVRVFVPADPKRTTIAPGSAIVGGLQEAPQGRTVVDYEGDIYGSESLARYADRVNQAAGRHADNYPTVARQMVPSDSLVEVGCYSPESGQVLLHGPEEQQLLADWLGATDIDSDELQASGVRFQVRHEIQQAMASHHPALRWEAQRMARRLGIEV